MGVPPQLSEAIRANRTMQVLLSEVDPVLLEVVPHQPINEVAVIVEDHNEKTLMEEFPRSEIHEMKSDLDAYLIIRRFLMI
jgi:hypothetical protein